ncbi:hypothetical protein F5148DRAFT_908390 [Russula earlei]|uniref:Uncharacterized protein n=1 Tax=Russula earlei TaxID=71964 RepID=A0ACC0UC55_9AGAM|nr:hypothetical protein F5148DRAFT_908390 [Russula earlei]
MRMNDADVKTFTRGQWVSHVFCFSPFPRFSLSPLRFFIFSPLLAHPNLFSHSDGAVWTTLIPKTSLALFSPCARVFSFRSPLFYRLFFLLDFSLIHSILEYSITCNTFDLACATFKRRTLHFSLLSYFIVFTAFSTACAILARRSDQCSKLPPQAMLKSPNSTPGCQESHIFPRTRFLSVRLCA